MHKTMTEPQTRSRNATPIDYIPPILIDTEMYDVLFEKFRKNKDLSFFPVVNRKMEPLGIVREFDLKDYTYTLFGRELVKRKKLNDFLTPCTTIDIAASQDEILRVSATSACAEGLIVIDGDKYAGFIRTGSLLSLSEKNRLATQDQLMISEKMASLGQMVAGLAHEINTPLGYSRSNVEMLRESHEEVSRLVKQFKLTQNKILSGDFQGIKSLLLDNQSLLKELEENPMEEQLDLFSGALDGLDRINDLVQSLKNFSRLDEADMKDSDINACLDSSLKIANHIIRKRAKVVRQFGILPMVDCYPAQLNQVFLNILVNAAQACERPSDPTYEGTITVSTAVQDRRIVIEISDNGKGIKAEHLNKIFEPFFTTKPVGSGTGLGLSIVYKIIERHKGHISVKSQVGVGTTFTIALPIAAEGHADAAPSLFN